MKKIIWIVLGISIICIIIGLFLILNNHINILINGDEVINIEVNSDYIDEGIKVLKGNKEVKDYSIATDNNLNVNVIGSYKIIYYINYHHKNYELTRTINVIDNVKPIISANKGEVEKDYCTGNYIDFTYTAIDNYDGDITDNIEIVEEENEIILKAADSSNNEEIVKIPFTISKKPNSMFKLNGNKQVYTVLNGTYNEKGAIYDDGCGNKIGKKISINGTVDTSKIGDYEIIYHVDGENDLKRIVTIYEPTTSILLPYKKVIYLTFDDGPGYYTRKVLDTLNKYNIKATFFVTNQFPSYVNLIQEEYENGHAIGVHTYTHLYDVYSSVDAYLNDFNKMNDVIKSYTGNYVRIFRFPGGSSNTISRSYSKGIMTELAKKMTEDGYIYFDWNVSSTDASGAGSDAIYNAVINGVNSCNKCVVLMHDIKATTANALDRILDTLTTRGYSFSILNEASPTAHHGINN